MDISTRQITSKKSMWKQRGFFEQRNYTNKSTWKQRGRFYHWNYIKKRVRGSNEDFSTIEITSKKVRGNNMDFSTSKSTSKKVRGNDVHFSIIEIKSKKYVQTTWKFVKIWSSTYPRDIDIESTWIRQGVPIGRCTNYFAFADKLQMTSC